MEAGEVTTPKAHVAELPHPEGEFEIKFRLAASLAETFHQFLSAHCRPDPLYPEAIVSSIYLDTRDLAFLEEKINSDYIKWKVRLRWYTGPDGRPIGDDSFFEVKRKFGSRRVKHRIVSGVPAARCATIGWHDPAFLAGVRELNRRGMIPIAGGLFPVMEIRYRRRRYVDRTTGRRIALDDSICVPRANPMMLPRHSAAPHQFAVLEFKGGDGEMPIGYHPLTRMGAHHTSLSKYLELWLRARADWMAGKLI
jgi:hypothetical protein